MVKHGSFQINISNLKQRRTFSFNRNNVKFKNQLRYVQALPKISCNAFLLLVWHLTTSALQRSASSTAHRTILWETVFVNNTIRSGFPICLLKVADICVKTFALQLKLLQTFLYWQTILSWPPIITTLILNLPILV